jgi:3-oxoacid CoA-transferase subunit A
MIKNWFITGDTHGKVAERLHHIPDTLNPEETAIIILGDAGFNFWLNTTDVKTKREANKYGYKIYCVRGNHEERPENIGSMETLFDENVCGPVFVESEFPNIRYFKDGRTYEINGHRTLVIGGAYSVDKWYRLSRAGLDEQTNNPAKTGWFPSELLTEDEMLQIASVTFGEEFDFVFSHTCPLSWEPRDLFLNFIDQSTVDKSMEQWLDVIKADIHWGVWCFGHFHKDRIERPRVEQFYGDIEDLEAVWNRWFNEKTMENEYWLEKSPNYHMEESV